MNEVIWQSDDSEAKKEKRKTSLQPKGAMGTIVEGAVEGKKKAEKTIIIETLVSLLHVWAHNSKGKNPWNALMIT